MSVTAHPETVTGLSVSKPDSNGFEIYIWADHPDAARKRQRVCRVNQPENPPYWQRDLPTYWTVSPIEFKVRNPATMELIMEALRWAAWIVDQLNADLAEVNAAREAAQREREEQRERERQERQRRYQEQQAIDAARREQLKVKHAALLEDLKWRIGDFIRVGRFDKKSYVFCTLDEVEPNPYGYWSGPQLIVTNEKGDRMRLNVREISSIDERVHEGKRGKYENIYTNDKRW